MPLSSTFTPSPADVERYKRLRGLARDLNSRIIKTIPREAIQQVAEAIGRLHGGVLVLGSEDESSVLMDCCLFDWIRDGKNLIEKYAENHPPAPGTAEHELLEAYRQAKYRIVVPQSRVQGAGAYFVDLLSGEELFIMDVGLSQNPLDVAYATRTIPLGQFWMTGGAGLPTGSEAIKIAIDRLTKQQLVEEGRFTEPHKVALVFVRTLLESGASKRVAYEAVENQRRQKFHSQFGGADVPQQKMSAYTPSRNSPCPCGSGKRYKRCCGAKV
jgi:SEC-C motif